MRFFGIAASVVEAILGRASNQAFQRNGRGRGFLVQTAKGIGENGIGRIAGLDGTLYLPDVGSKTALFSSAFAGISASN